MENKKEVDTFRWKTKGDYKIIPSIIGRSPKIIPSIIGRGLLKEQRNTN